MKIKHCMATATIALAAVVAVIVLFNTSKRVPQETPTIEEKKHADEKLTFLISQSYIVAAKYLADKFYDKTGVVIEVINVPYSELEQKIVEYHNSNSAGVDVVLLWYTHIGSLVEDGILVDLTDFIKKNEDILNPEDFIPVIYKAFTLHKNRRWGIPFDGDTHAMFYNKTLFERHDLAPPQTWNEYLKLSEIITEREKENGIFGNAIMAEPVPIIIISAFMNRLSSYGGKLLDENNKPLLNSPEAIATIQDMVEQAKYSLPTPVETGFRVCVDSFLSGQVAMVEQWTDIGIMAEDETKSLIKGEWGIIPIPAGDRKKQHHLSLNAGYTIAVPTKSSNRELAKEFLLFATSPSMTLELNLIKGGSGVDPVRFSTINSQEFKNFAPQVSELERKWLPHAKPWPTVPQMPEMMIVLARNLRFALEGTINPEQALLETNQQWEQLLSE